ncbi:MAG TPA: SCO family protein [Crocinitomicaceae bacterium]|nr:SCO family protein [Crocinitomicaceae bacterium]
MKAFSIILSVAVFLFSCAGNKQKELKDLPENSIFHLTSNWKNQDNESLQLNDLRGKTLVVVMIYTSCQSACPILVSKMKQIERQIDPKYMENVNLVLVTIDPENDTPEKLKQFAKLNQMNDPQWTFLTSNEDDTQELANVLAMKYKKIDPIDFSHSNIITIFSPEGEMVIQEEGLEINVKKVAETVNKTVKVFN